MGGVIIWGATNDVINRERCLNLLKYLDETLGPTLLKVRKGGNKKAAESQLQPETQTQTLTRPQPQPQPEFEFVPLVLVPSYSNRTKKLNYKYEVLSRPERSTTTTTTTTSATPRLARVSMWYERVLRAIFNT